MRDLKQWPSSDRITQRGVMEIVKKRDKEDFILSLNPKRNLEFHMYHKALSPSQTTSLAFYPDKLMRL